MDSLWNLSLKSSPVLKWLIVKLVLMLQGKFTFFNSWYPLDSKNTTIAPSSSRAEIQGGDLLHRSGVSLL